MAKKVSPWSNSRCNAGDVRKLELSTDYATTCDDTGQLTALSIK